MHFKKLDLNRLNLSIKNIRWFYFKENIEMANCLIKNILLQMRIYVTLIILICFTLVTSISQYDFNACRISNCNAEEINCLSDESGCLNYFATMRNCFATCGDSKNWNGCWGGCKNAPARTNSYYLSMSLCYENLCYLSEKWVFMMIALVLLVLMI